MTRTFKLMTLMALGAWLLTSAGCEDKVCKEQLQTCKKDSDEQRKECSSNLSKLQELKGELAEAQAKVDTLTTENEELKKSAEASTKGKGKTAKGKSAKGKHKKRGKR